MQTVYFWVLFFTVSFETLIFLHQLMEHYSVEQRVVIVLVKNTFFSIFCQKSWNFWIFLIQIRRSPLRTAFLNFDAFSANALGGSICLLFSCIDNVVFDRGWTFRQPKICRQQVFGKNIWKPRFFRGQVLLFHNSLPYYAIYRIPILVRRQTMTH